MKTLQINAKSILVQVIDGSTLLVARYDDNNGTYFFNENLEKQYAAVAVVEKQKPANKVSKSNNLRFEFYVEYWSGENAKRKFSTVWAKNEQKAFEKIEKNFKSIVTLELC
jgi:hypothetical protein